ncbi:MAG: GDP-mannose 4,6-dehydratase, partial [Gammaproteobacteria bacterium]|nr:GDP-mannose 4,6-dehydratase [Gammaproteobacteria bacterium]
MTKRVLITGGLGFIGSHTVEHYLATTDWDIVVIDALRHAGRVERVTEMQNYDPARVTLLWHDLRAPLHDMLRDNIGPVNYIVNMASDSHVDRSISDPVDFVQNNISLALNMLEFARGGGGGGPPPPKLIQAPRGELSAPPVPGPPPKQGGPLAPPNPSP